VTLKVSLVDDTDGYIDAINVSDALRFAATGTNTDTASKYSKANNKKKSVKSAVKKKVGNMAEEVGRHLEEYGWAVCDHTIPEDLVRRVRIESGLFVDHFEQAEIWVGKQADIGAQLVVPSVRGDKVLWMCGGHNSTAPEGVTRTVRTIGEIEPCRLEIKAQAPIKSFKAMKELVATIDKLVYSMKEKCPSLGGIYERSDAMLSIYPGEGARFAKHIDNTTRDGRRLTVLVYLNPGWTPNQGGALRLFTANAKKAIDERRPQQGDERASQEDDKEGDAEASYEGTRKIHCIDGVEPSRMTAVDVFPEGGRLAMFYSADVPHEVLPTFGMRHAITIWYYDTEERQAAVKAAVDKGIVDTATHASVESQRAAKNFIAELMGGDEVAADGGEPAQDELTALCARVTGLSDEVLGMVASITGAPSVQSFREGFPLLTTDDLKQMRALFRRMGLASYDLA
jgi:hypoxia-inducible factor prolyl hydroxylase